MRVMRSGRGSGGREGGRTETCERDSAVTRELKRRISFLKKSFFFLFLVY